MNKKRYALVFICAIVLFSLVSCASKDDEEVIDLYAPESQLFSDWQYRGFGSAYPLWCEAALKNDIQTLCLVFPELEGKEDETVLIRAEGNDADMCMKQAQEIEEGYSDFTLVAQSWVSIDMKDGTTKYICIKVGFRENRQEESL